MFLALAAPLYAGSFCKAFLATVNAVPDYYASSMRMPLKDLAYMPKKFYLDLAGADEVMVSFRNVQRTQTKVSRSSLSLWNSSLLTNISNANKCST